MYSSHGRSRRRRDSPGEDDEATTPLLVSRAEEPRSDPYSRPHQFSHHTKSYRASSTTMSTRAPYDANREASSSRSHRDSMDWRAGDDSHASPDRYSYSSSKDTYNRGGRDDYDTAESKDFETWAARPSGDSHSTSRPEWTQRYDQNYSSTSWNAPVAYENRSTHDQWPEDDHSRPPDERDSRLALEDRPVDRGASGWHRDERRETKGQNWRRDSGWDTRRVENRNKIRNEPRQWNNASHADSHHSHHSVDDRSWEPAPTWQPSNRSDLQGQRHHNGRSNHSNKNSKGGKKGQQHNKQRRDWRTDDGNLNK